MSSRRVPANHQSTYDCIIVGGGPAGLTCAIFLGRCRRRVLLLDNGRPRNYAAQAIHGFLGQYEISPRELLKRGRAEAQAVGVEFCDCTVEKIQRVGDCFDVMTSVGKMSGRRVVLAYGVRDKLPDIPNLEKYYGGSIHHCPDCDGYEVTGKRIGIIGSGKKAVSLALKLLQWSDQLTVLTDGHEREWTTEHTSKLLALSIDVKDEKIVALTGDPPRLTAAVLSSGEQVALDAVFFIIGTEPSCRLAEDLGCAAIEDTPCFVVDDYKQTTVEGVYAIGDLAPGAQLAITAAADGAVAAIAVNKSLLEPARRV
ncbi:MAG TPA: NAD(P)/FAD-dependent oxidoreductase [Thermoanaerobaculia bacterium]|jgi:thioredoxin reductase|nr:NAD(P)/FAD-dependent oxidoreductase [Thermoanaerobaculia bacterium]